jgi:hypothetical protein
LDFLERSEEVAVKIRVAVNFVEFEQALIWLETGHVVVELDAQNAEKE